jgi:hypothetical protein
MNAVQRRRIAFRIKSDRIRRETGAQEPDGYTIVTEKRQRNISPAPSVSNAGETPSKRPVERPRLATRATENLDNQMQMQRWLGDITTAPSEIEMEGTADEL